VDVQRRGGLSPNQFRAGFRGREVSRVSQRNVPLPSLVWYLRKPPRRCFDDV